MSAADLERAIQITLSAAAPRDVKLQALEFCESVKTSADGWIFALGLIFRPDANVQVKFFCFGIIQDLIQNRHGSLSSEQRQTLRTSLVTWLREYLPANLGEPHALKNKLAQVLAMLFKAEYPSDWTRFFEDVFGALDVEACMQRSSSNQLEVLQLEMILRILQAIDSEVVTREVFRSNAEIAQNTIIKDHMRDHAISSFVQLWNSVLLKYLPCAGSTGGASPSPLDCPSSLGVGLLNSCLLTMKCFIGWIDINLTANDNFMQLFFSLLSAPPTRLAACECFYEVVSKGMEPVSKLALIERLRLISIISNTNDTDEDEEVVARMARIVNAMGIELLGAQAAVAAMVDQNKLGPEAKDKAQSIINEVFTLMLRYLNHSDAKISACVFSFVGSLLDQLKANGADKLTPKDLENLQMLLHVIRSKLRYPVDYDFQHPEDDLQKNFILYRGELSTYCKNTGRVAPDLLVQFVHQTLQFVISADVKSVPFEDMEVALHLLHLLGDGLLDDSRKALVAQSFLSQQLMQLIGSDVSRHASPAVVLMFFENVVRFAGQLTLTEAPAQQALLQAVAAFLDTRGLRHPDRAVRSAVAYLFLRFVSTKTLRMLLVQYLSSILESLLPLLTLSAETQRTFPFDVQQSLLEALGILIGANSLLGGSKTHEDQPRQTELVMTPLINRLSELLQQRAITLPPTTEEAVLASLSLSQAIQAVGLFSKGFRAPLSQVSSPERDKVLLHFTKAFGVILDLQRTAMMSSDLLAKFVFFQHCMIECLGIKILPYVPIMTSLLMVKCTAREVNDFIRLLSQMICHFKEQMVSVVDEVLMSLLIKTFEFPFTPPANPLEDLSDDERQRQELGKNYFVLLGNICNCNCARVLYSPKNRSHFYPAVMKTILDACSAVQAKGTDVQVCKTSWGIVKNIVLLWGGSTGDTTNKPEGFDAFVMEHIAPRLVMLLLKFDPNGAHDSVLSEVVRVQKVMVERFPVLFPQYVQTWLQSISCPADLAQKFLTALQQQEGDLRTFLRTFVKLTHQR